MPGSRSDVVRLSTPAELICAIESMLGFDPRDSLVVLCLHGERRRVGLAMRFDLVPPVVAKDFARDIRRRIRLEQADGVFLAVFSPDRPTDARLPHGVLVDAVLALLDVPLVDAVLASEDRWWSYLCAKSCCGGLAGMPLDRKAPGAVAVAAAYAIAGQGPLPDRAAVVRSVALELDPAEVDRMRARIDDQQQQVAGRSRGDRRVAVVPLAERLAASVADPRGSISPDDLAEFVALCDDVVVRDEVLVKADDPAARERLVPMLRVAAGRVPPPFDPPLCSMLAWFAYAGGDGVIANVAIDRALATDPSYSLALLIADALFNQVPPSVLKEVMRGAARDLSRRSAAG
jgi:hypothetical protein